MKRAHCPASLQRHPNWDSIPVHLLSAPQLVLLGSKLRCLHFRHSEVNHCYYFFFHDHLCMKQFYPFTLIQIGS